MQHAHDIMLAMPPWAGCPIFLKDLEERFLEPKLLRGPRRMEAAPWKSSCPPRNSPQTRQRMLNVGGLDT